MLIVAVDTTTRAGSLALVRDGTVVEAVIGDALRTHGERLPGDLLDLLARHRVEVADVDVFAVAAGPGSFTGLRIGIAAIQGLAFANRRPMVAVSALEALASAPSPAEGPGADGSVAVWMDAQRHEVFSAVYRVEAPSDPDSRAAALPRLHAIAGPAVLPPDATLEGWRTEPWWPPGRFVGDGALRYRGLLEAGLSMAVAIADPVPALAPTIGLMAEVRARRGDTTSPHAVRPIYVRRPDAELARDRRTAP